MNDPKLIHETVLKDIIDAASGIGDLVKSIQDNPGNLPKKGAMNVSSIAKASSNLTMVFPVLASRNVSIERASMISKALEKKFVTMLQMLFASVQISSDDNIRTVQDYINQFHGNISTKVADLDDLFNMVEATDVLKEMAVAEDMKNINYTLPDEISKMSLREMFTVNNESGVYYDPDIDAMDTYSTDLHVKKTKLQRDRDEMLRARQNDNNDLKNKIDNAKYNNDMMNAMKNKGEYIHKQVLDGDYKKANDLMPTTMYVNFTVQPENGSEPIKVQDGVVGVKAKLYPISSDDVINHLVDKDKSRNWITNFIRATTREISFFKDFLFGVDKAKADAMSLSRKGTSNKMWKVLERRSIGSKAKRIARQSNNLAAITTLIISQDEVEYMKKNFNVDMERLSSIVNLFNNLNLIGVVIVDEALEIAKFVFDEADPSWETISFTHLEREASDNTYKKVVNLMTKMR